MRTASLFFIAGIFLLACGDGDKLRSRFQMDGGGDGADAQQSSEDAAAADDDAGADPGAATGSALPRPPGELPRPPGDRLPDELKPPSLAP